MTEDWHSGTALTGWLRSATGANASILANPAPLRNCIRNTKRQQWRTDSPKKLPTLPKAPILMGVVLGREVLTLSHNMTIVNHLYENI